MAVILPQAFPLGPLDRLNVSMEFLLVLRIDEKPLLELRQSIGLCILALIIAIIGIFVQVKKIIAIQIFLIKRSLKISISYETFFMF
jgi:hypothetical protein